MGLRFPERRRAVPTGGRSGAAAAVAARAVLAALAAVTALALASTLLTVAVPGCAKRPADPSWSNPFDPDGPDHGDPWRVRAILSGNTIEVLWDAVTAQGIDHLEVLHSTDGTHYDVANANPIGRQMISFQHTKDSPSPPAFNAVNWYKVRAVDAAGNVSSLSREAPAETLIGPYLAIAGGASATATRHVSLTIRTTVGDTLEVAADSLFTSALKLQAVAGGEDQTIADYDLGPAAGNNVLKSVWVRVKTGSVFSPLAHATIRTAFQPVLRLATSAPTLATRRVTVQYTAAGVVEARLAADVDSAVARAALATAAPVTPDSISGGNAYFTGTLLTANGQRQWIYGRMTGDFGYAWIDTTHALPDNLQSATFTLAGGAAVTAVDTVALASSAVATQMRFSEDPSFTGVPWLTYAPSIQFALTPAPGLKTVYGEFRNDWFTAARVDSIRLLGTR